MDRKRILYLAIFIAFETRSSYSGKRTFSRRVRSFDDSLPDGWGALILDRYLLQRGIDVNRLTLLERLALVGSTGRGALEYRPDESLQLDNSFLISTNSQLK
jgi:hypothetical protein